MNTNIDMSRELILHRHHNGVQLRRPSALTSELCLANVMARRISVFFKTPDHVMFDANDHQLECTNCESRDTIIGHHFTRIVTNESTARKIEVNNLAVISTEKTLFFSEDVHIGEDLTKAISVKMPWYDADDQILGLFGFAYITDTPCAPSNPIDFTETVNSFFDANQPTPQHTRIKSASNTNYSDREMDVIRLILRGKTIRDTAALLNISPRTAEHYCSNIKTKAGVKTRAELIEKLLRQGFKLL